MSPELPERKLGVTWMQELNLIFAVFGLVLIRKTLLLEESGYSAAVIGGFMRTAWIMKIYMKVVAGYIYPLC